jgi:hypothetical protein
MTERTREEKPSPEGEKAGSYTGWMKLALRVLLAAAGAVLVTGAGFASFILGTHDLRDSKDLRFACLCCPCSPCCP